MAAAAAISRLVARQKAFLVLSNGLGGASSATSSLSKASHVRNFSSNRRTNFDKVKDYSMKIWDKLDNSGKMLKLPECLCLISRWDKLPESTKHHYLNVFYSNTNYVMSVAVLPLLIGYLLAEIVKAENASNEDQVVKAENASNEDQDVQADKMLFEAENMRSEALNMRSEALDMRWEAQNLRSEANRTREEAQKMYDAAEKLRLEAQKLHSEAEKLKAEAEVLKMWNAAHVNLSDAAIDKD